MSELLVVVPSLAVAGLAALVCVGVGLLARSNAGTLGVLPPPRSGDVLRVLLPDAVAGCEC